jgi:hypothetical protein
MRRTSSRARGAVLAVVLALTGEAAVPARSAFADDAPTADDAGAPAPPAAPPSAAPPSVAPPAVVAAPPALARSVVVLEKPEVHPPKSTNERLRPFAFIAGGIGVAGLTTFAIAGAMTASTHSDLADACRGRCPESYRGTIARGVREQTIANIGLVVGATGAIIGLSLFLISKPTPANPHPSALVLTPGGVAWSGSL